VRDLALARLAALRPREGWVPRVPDAGSTALAGRTDGPGPAESPVAAVEPGSGPPWPDETWPAADAWFGPLSTTSDPPGDPPGDPTGDAGRDGDASGPTGRHGADALADRIPLAVRTALAASVPDSVRAGRVGLGTGQAVVILLVAVLALGGAALVLLVSRPGAEPAPALAPVAEASGTPVPQHGAVPDTDAAGPAAAGTAAPTSGSGTTDLVVHVAGKVVRPGVVRLPPGSRVVDAIDAAGGAEGGVDLTPLNLARQLSDGEQVLVGVDPPPGGEVVEGGSGPGAAAPAGAPPGSLGDPRLDLNTATATQLEELPGVGPVLAARIVAWREENGRFTSTDELREVSGIGPKTYEALADLVRV
jgi:competence protein ComEA